MASAPSTPSSASASLTTPTDIDMGGTTTVSLDTIDIDQTMAARLTIALLDHMLYMKGQVPFPVQSVARMAQHEATESISRSRTAMRTDKKRIDFLQSYDDLTSHLHTTFIALSTALAMNETRHPLVSEAPSLSPARPPAKIYVLLILGSSPSSAKSRVLLELDGLRIEKFGEQELLRIGRTEASADGGSKYSDDDISDDDRASDHDSESDGSSASVSSSRVSGASSVIPPHTPFTPPLQTSRLNGSANPSPSSSRAKFPPLSPSPSSEDVFSDTEDSTDSVDQHTKVANNFVFVQRTEEAVLRAGERLLSRALFAAGEGLGFGDEISPTQAHILIRAPRRLAHSTWVPRESLGGMLDRHVKRYLESESYETRTGGLSGKGAFGTGVRTFGMRVTCKNAKAASDGSLASREPILSGEDESDDGVDEDDDMEDDMIWWSWDGKLVGFAD